MQPGSAYQPRRAFMATYCVQADIENVFGAINVAKWSNLDNDSDAAAVDSTRVTEAIAQASAEIEDRMRGVYAVPLTGTSTTKKIKDWAAKLAGVWLYEARGQRNALDQDENTNTVRLHRPIVEREMDEVLSGVRSLELTRADGRNVTAPFMI